MIRPRWDVTETPDPDRWALRKDGVPVYYGSLAMVYDDAERMNRKEAPDVAEEAR